MIDSEVRGTRARILAVARDLFARQGCQHTSIREIAEHLGLTKTAVLYHFATKADILATLAQPLIEDMEGALDEVARSGGGRWRTIEALLEVYLTHRAVLSLVVQNMTTFDEPVFLRWFAAMNRANELVAGTAPDLAERVRAIQLVGVLSDPVILLADAPEDELRRHILDGARRLLGPAEAPTVHALPPSALSSAARAVVEAQPSEAGPSDAGPSPQRGGRPRAMTSEMIAEARRMHEGGSRSMAEIAAALGVSRATLYRHLRP